MTFVYSTCKDTCPAQVQSIRGALDKLGHDVPVLAVSVDPKQDTPARAKAFLLKQHVTGRVRYVLGTQAELAPVWRGYGIAPQRGSLDHSAYVVVVDARGRQRIGFPHSELTPEGLASDLRRLD
jgi:protein SCO1/2